MTSHRYWGKDIKKLERIQMLQPENRIEELFTEGNTTEAIESGRINISEINFGGIAGEYYANSVEIPPISLRARYFCRLLPMIEERTYGKFAREKEKLMQMAIGFKIHDVDSAREISKLVILLDRLEHEAYEDSRLGANCARYKPLVFKEVRWLLMLRALTYLKYFNVGLVLSTSSFLVRANSISISVRGRCVLPTSPSLPAL